MRRTNEAVSRVRPVDLEGSYGDSDEELSDSSRWRRINGLSATYTQRAAPFFLSFFCFDLINFMLLSRRPFVFFFFLYVFVMFSICLNVMRRSVPARSLIDAMRFFSK